MPDFGVAAQPFFPLGGGERDAAGTADLEKTLEGFRGNRVEVDHEGAFFPFEQHFGVGHAPPSRMVEVDFLDVVPTHFRFLRREDAVFENQLVVGGDDVVQPIAEHQNDGDTHEQRGGQGSRLGHLAG